MILSSFADYFNIDFQNLFFTPPPNINPHKKEKTARSGFLFRFRFYKSERSMLSRVSI